MLSTVLPKWLTYRLLKYPLKWQQWPKLQNYDFKKAMPTRTLSNYNTPKTILTILVAHFDESN